jgi:hypothetical protein
MEQPLVLTRENLGAVLYRFWSFEDGVVRSVTLSGSGTRRTVVVVIECMDREAERIRGGERPGWAHVELVVRTVSQFRFELGRTTYSVLSGGIQVAWRGEKIYVVLDAYPDEPEDLPDLKTNTAFVVGESCEVRVLPAEA